MKDFNLTKEAAAIAVEALAIEGNLDIRIERTGKDTFEVSFCKGSVEIFKGKPYEIAEGNTLTLSGLKLVLDIEAWM